MATANYVSIPQTKIRERMEFRTLVSGIHVNNKDNMKADRQKNLKSKGSVVKYFHLTQETCYIEANPKVKHTVEKFREKIDVTAIVSGIHVKMPNFFISQTFKITVKFI